MGVHAVVAVEVAGKEADEESDGRRWGAAASVVVDSEMAVETDGG